MQTEIMNGGTTGARTDLATAEAIRLAFDWQWEELRWLAEFLTGDGELAEACVTDASSVAVARGEMCQEYFSFWARLATVRSALDIQQLRISELAPVYASRTCGHRDHPQLTREETEFLVEESPLIQLQLDVLSRAVLLLCGVEQLSSCETAALLRVSWIVVEAAYCAALESLEAIQCQLIIDSRDWGACN